MRSLIAAIAMCISGQAAAGDTAELGILGFSADGSIFAFEEYGIQDGSGFAYANRYYIETATDSFVTGTPIRVLSEEQDASIEDARAKARLQGADIVDENELAANRGFTAGANAVTEISADPLAMEVNPRPVFPPIDPPLAIRLEEIAFEVPENCAFAAERHVGFRLLKVSHEGGVATELLHEDESVPASRSCPLGYRIGAVQTFFPEGGEPVFVVLIAVRRVGFEGPDHRWIAVPGKL
jgi:predicted secreted protein